MKRRARDEGGASAVEFALVMPIFFLLIFGIIAFGVVFAQELALGNGAREAARYGVVNGRTCGEIKSAAKQAANTIAMNGDEVTVSITRGTAPDSATNACGSDANVPCKGSSADESIFVELGFKSELIIPLAIVKDEFALTGDGVFRCEFS